MCLLSSGDNSSDGVSDKQMWGVIVNPEPLNNADVAFTTHHDSDWIFALEVRKLSFIKKEHQSRKTSQARGSYCWEVRS